MAYSKHPVNDASCFEGGLMMQNSYICWIMGFGGIFQVKEFEPREYINSLGDEGERVIKITVY